MNAPRDPGRRSGGGLFLTFEGIEGSGKTTQLRRIASALRRAGAPPVVTQEPGGTPLGERLRSLLLARTGHGPTPLAELLLYVADRAQHLEQVVIPALRAGSVVLCDRYLDATLAYQGYARGLDPALIERLHADPPLDLRPDRTVLFDLEPADALRRARERNRERGTVDAEGRFEAEPLSFHRRVREGYLTLARREPQRFRVVESGGSEDAVAGRVTEALADLLPALGGDAGP